MASAPLPDLGPAPCELPPLSPPELDALRTRAAVELAAGRGADASLATLLADASLAQFATEGRIRRVFRDLEREARDAGRAKAEDPEGGRLDRWQSWRPLASAVRRALMAGEPSSQAEADFRGSLAAIGDCFGANRGLLFVVEDAGRTSRILLAVRGAFAAKSGDPVLSVEYAHALKGTKEEDASREAFGALSAEHGGAVRIPATVEEIDKCWLPALDRRALPHLPASHPALRRSSIPCEDPLPAPPPAEKDGDAPPGVCARCREPAPFSCPSCGAIQYCSPACLDALSPFHAPQCSAAPPTLDGTVILPALAPSAPSARPPPNPHGMRAFPIKLQLSTTGTLLLTDEDKDLLRYVNPDEPGDAWGELSRVCRRKGEGGIRIYVLGRREGGWVRVWTRPPAGQEELATRF